MTRRHAYIYALRKLKSDINARVHQREAANSINLRNCVSPRVEDYGGILGGLSPGLCHVA